MARGQARKGFGRMLRLACVLLLLAMGMLHQTPASAGSELRLPDGSQISLCTVNTQDSGHHGKTDWHGCEVCRLCSGVLLVAPPAFARVEPLAVRLLGVPDIEQLTSSRIETPQARPRAPPYERDAA